jgi:hypothetical protein
MDKSIRRLDLYILVCYRNWRYFKKFDLMPVCESIRDQRQNYGEYKYKKSEK